MSRRHPTIRVERDDCVRTGSVVDLRGAGLDPDRVGRAVRDGPVDGLSVDCPDPYEVHEHVGVVHERVTVAVRPALAAAARSRGLSAPQDDELVAVRERLADLPPPRSSEGDLSADDSPDPAAARRRLAGTESEVERLRERVATVRGRLEAAREAGRNVDDLESALTEAARALSEAETERAAAREALERAERRARADRDARERRRRLEDRVANLERAVRAHFVDRLREEYTAAVADLRAVTDDEDATDPFAVDGVLAALAVCRVADLRAPVVLACDRFDDPREAAEWLDAPVVRV